VYLAEFYRFGYLCAKSYQVWWRFDKVTTKTSWIIFLARNNITLVITSAEAKQKKKELCFGVS